MPRTAACTLWIVDSRAVLFRAVGTKGGRGWKCCDCPLPPDFGWNKVLDYYSFQPPPPIFRPSYGPAIITAVQCSAQRVLQLCCTGAGRTESLPFCIKRAALRLSLATLLQGLQKIVAQSRVIAFATTTYISSSRVFSISF